MAMVFLRQHLLLSHRLQSSHVMKLALKCDLQELVSLLYSYKLFVIFFQPGPWWVLCNPG